MRKPLFLIRKSLKIVNHKDCNKLNNNVENLEWVTVQGNEKHALENGLKVRGSKVGTSKLVEEQVHKIRALADNYTAVEIGKMFNVHNSNIGLIINRKTWAHI